MSQYNGFVFTRNLKMPCSLMYSILEAYSLMISSIVVASEERVELVKMFPVASIVEVEFAARASVTFWATVESVFLIASLCLAALTTTEPKVDLRRKRPDRLATRMTIITKIFMLCGAWIGGSRKENKLGKQFGNTTHLILKGKKANVPQETMSPCQPSLTEAYD